MGKEVVSIKITMLAVYGGIITASLGIIGLVNGEGRIGDIINMNLMLDSARIVLGAILIIGGLRSAEAARNAFTVFAVVSLGIFMLGIISPTIFGFLPAGLGWFDQTFHLASGFVGLFLKNYGIQRRKRLAY